MFSLRSVLNPADIQIASTLAREIWVDHYTPIVGREQVDYMLNKFQSTSALLQQISDGYEYFLAEINHEPVGYTAILHDTANATSLLSKLYVLKTQRGKGCGYQMVAFAVSQCLEKNSRTLWLTVNRDNVDSIAFYRRVGFEIAGPLVQEIGGGFIMDDYKMEKVIAAAPA